MIKPLGRTSELIPLSSDSKMIACTFRTSSTITRRRSASSSSRRRPTRPGPSCSRQSLACRRLQPSFVSVTYGAGGSTRERTHDLVVRITKETNLTAVSHLTCVCHSQHELAAILDRYAASGIENILALSGDPPRTSRSTTAPRTPSATPTNWCGSSEAECAQVARVSASAWPASPRGTRRRPNRLLEMDYLKRKVDAGADYICTQLFFDNRDFYDFRERCDLAGIKVPIVAGIMPITSQAGMERMAELALGARDPGRPAPRHRPVQRRRSGGSRRRPLGDGAVPRPARPQVRGIHFYTLNVRRDAADLREPRRCRLN